MSSLWNLSLTSDAPFLANLAMPMFGIASPTAIKKHGDDYFKNRWYRSFRFREWRKDDRIVLERNPTTGVKRPYSIMLTAPSSTTLPLLELQAGSIDLMEFLNPDDIPSVKNDANLRLILRPSMNVGYLWWNVEKEPFSKLDVRRAIAHAVNKRVIVEKLFGGIGIPAKNMLPPSLWGYEAVVDYEYDPPRRVSTSPKPAWRTASKPSCGRCRIHDRTCAHENRRSHPGGPESRGHRRRHRHHGLGHLSGQDTRRRARHVHAGLDR